MNILNILKVFLNNIAYSINKTFHNSFNSESNFEKSGFNNNNKCIVVISSFIFVFFYAFNNSEKTKGFSL